MVQANDVLLNHSLTKYFRMVWLYVQTFENYMKKTEELLHNCLYFTANSIARKITRMAEEEFRVTGLSPSHAFIIMLVCDYPGIGPKKLGEYLNLAPSTITRLVDSLIYKGYLTKQTSGKNSEILVTDQGEKLQESVSDAWKNLYLRYSKILGEKEGIDLTEMIDVASKKL